MHEHVSIQLVIRLLWNWSSSINIHWNGK